jgi:hypothetical protein
MAKQRKTSSKLGSELEARFVDDLELPNRPSENPVRVSRGKDSRRAS